MHRPAMSQAEDKNNARRISTSDQRMHFKRLNMIVGRGSCGVNNRSPYASAAGLLCSNTTSTCRPADSIRSHRSRRRPCWKTTLVDLPFHGSIIHQYPAVSAAASAITSVSEASGDSILALQQELIARHDLDDKPVRLLAAADELEAGTVTWSVPELRDSASANSGIEHDKNDEALESWLVRGAVDNFLPPASCQWLINVSEAAARAIPPISDAEFSLYLLGGGAEAVLGPVANEAYNVLLQRIKDELEKRTCLDSKQRLEVAGAILYRLKAAKPGENQVHVCNAHIDKANKDKYDVSSIMYLNTHGIDFTGGEFVFVDEDANLHVRPRAGRLLYFSSGAENLHKIQPVSSGSRWVVASWFTVVGPE